MRLFSKFLRKKSTGKDHITDRTSLIEAPIEGNISINQEDTAVEIFEQGAFQDFSANFFDNIKQKTENSEQSESTDGEVGTQPIKTEYYPFKQEYTSPRINMSIPWNSVVNSEQLDYDKIKQENAIWLQKIEDCKARMAKEANIQALEKREIIEYKRILQKEKRENKRNTFCEFKMGDWCSKYDFSPVNCHKGCNLYKCSWNERHFSNSVVQYSDENEHTKTLSLFDEFYYDQTAFNKENYEDISDFYEYLRNHTNI